MLDSGGKDAEYWASERALTVGSAGRARPTPFGDMMPNMCARVCFLFV